MQFLQRLADQKMNSRRGDVQLVALDPRDDRLRHHDRDERDQKQQGDRPGLQNRNPIMKSGAALLELIGNPSSMKNVCRPIPSPAECSVGIEEPELPTAPTS